MTFRNGRYRQPNGRATTLLSVGADTKTEKSLGYGILTGILYLAPHAVSGVGNVCPFASNGCASACLYSAGRGKFNRTQAARIRRTHAWFAHRRQFLTALDGDIYRLRHEARRRGFKPAVRLNGTSDIAWERFGVMDRHPDVAFYDYTKDTGRMGRFVSGDMPENYQLTYSVSETPGDVSAGLWFMAQGGTAAVVLDVAKREPMPLFWRGHPVTDGDRHDYRYDDPAGCWVGLRPKGAAKNDRTGFVYPVD